MWYISPDIADKLLPVAARGDIEGVFLAMLINLTILGLLSIGIVSSVKIVSKYVKKYQNKLSYSRQLKR